MNQGQLGWWMRFANRRNSRRQFARAAGGGLALFSARVTTSGAWSQESTPCPATTADEAQAIGEAYFAAFNAGDADALGALLAPDYRHHGALVSEQDRSLHQERLRINREAFPDGQYELADIFAQGDLVAIRNIFTGTLQGPYAGVEPAGQPVAVRAVHIHRVACGQIVETWNSGDGLGLLRQIGALPSPGPSPRTPVEEIATPATSPTADACPPGSAEESAAIGRRWTEEALDERNLDLLDEFVAPNLVHHAGLFVDEIGRDALKEDLAALLAAFPDSRFSADVVVATDDRAAVRWTGRGTHEGELQGLAPTGLPVVFTGVNVYRIECGQIVEGWSEPDALGLLRQLGVVPEITPGPATPTG
jgi:predicted ester cyclase